MKTRAEFALCALTYIDTPWVHQGRLKGIAIDCIGVVGLVGAECGSPEAVTWLADMPLHRYGRAPNVEATYAAADKYMDRCDDDAPIQLADVFIMRAPKDLEPRHFAIVSSLDPVYIVHAYMQVKKVVRNIYDANYAARTHRRYSYRGFA